MPILSSGKLKGLTKLCEEGHLHEALKIVELLEYGDLLISTNIYYSLLQGCINKKDLDAGREVHGLIMRRQLDSNSYVGSHLIRMFASCGTLYEANQVFSKLSKPDVFAWSTIISAHAKRGKNEEAIKLYQKLHESSVKPNEYAFVAALMACADMGALDCGNTIHAHIVEDGCESHLYVGNTLIDMYAKCGSLEAARRVFDKLPERDVVTWTSMIAGYAQQDSGLDAVLLFQQMQLEGMEPNRVTFVCLLKACCRTTALDQGKLIHVCIVQRGSGHNEVIGNALIDMYVKCGTLKDARIVFDKLPTRNVITWSSIIGGYAEYGHGEEALCLFQHMKEEGIVPNDVTCICILKACSSITALNQGILIHGHIIESGFDEDEFVGSTLIDMYTNCGRIEDARRVFDRSPSRDVVTWTAMIAGYAQWGHGQEALHLSQIMEQWGMKPNNVTLASILKACASVASLDQGKTIHDFIVKNGFEWDDLLGNALIDMYGKCGGIWEARKVFDGLPKRDVVAWSAMIGGYAHLSDYKLALQYFRNMKHEGLNPDDGAFVSLLSACSHVGLVDEGCHYFKLMREYHGITPTLDLYNCFVDLLGRAGHLNAAEDVLQTIPFQHNIVGWTSLLSHCKGYSSVEVARRCFNCIVMTEKRHASGYVLVSNLYKDAGMWEDTKKTLDMKDSMYAFKKPGRAFIEVDSKVHDFFVGDRSHSQTDAIHKILKKLNLQTAEEGHVPGFNSSVQLV